MKIDENLSSVFDIEQMPKEVQGELITVEPQKRVVEDPPQNKEIDKDFNAARDNLYSLLKSGQDALQDALAIARQSEHPRAFEVVGNLMKQLADINEQILNLHAKKQRIETPIKAKDEDSGKKVTNNAIFVGSTSELSKLIENMKGE